MSLVTKIPKEYECLFKDEYLYYVFYGGRGGGKTENIAQCLVLLATMKPLRILCIRENQNSIAESVKSTIESWIQKLDLLNYFIITQSSIRGTNGSEFIFMGMRNSNAVNVKSISNINISWVEESEAFSKRSWTLLVPSVIRTKNPKIILSFNPNREDDIVYKEFLSGNPPKNSLIQKVNYYDNPYFKGSVLEQQMLDDKERLPPWEFNHKWLGELARYTEDSLFEKANFEPLNIDVDDLALLKRLYTKIIIACDPATTNNDFSNEYGVIVLGKTEDGIIHCIKDLSNKYNPLDFSKCVSEAYHKYNAEEVIVEVNNGGDFIKATLLLQDPTLNIYEVRATKDKVKRALPLANLMSLNKVRLATPFAELERQMKLTTNLGFMGTKGESPDRLDAFVWGVYRLANIKDKESIHSVFNPNEFNTDKEYLKVCYVVAENILYSALINDLFFCIEFNVLKNSLDYRLMITKSYVKDIKAYFDLINKERANERNLLRDTGAVRTYINNLNVNTYEPLKEKEIDLKVINILPFIKQSKIYFDENIPLECYNNNKGQLILIDLAEYKYDTDLQYPFLELLCDIVYNEFEINKDK